VISKPKRISVADGVVHIVVLLVKNLTYCTSMYHYYMTKPP